MQTLSSQVIYRASTFQMLIMLISNAKVRVLLGFNSPVQLHPRYNAGGSDAQVLVTVESKET